MPDQNPRPGEVPQQASDPTVAEPTRMGRDDPAAPSPQQQAEGDHKPPPRRDNQGEAITGAPTV